MCKSENDVDNDKYRNRKKKNQNKKFENKNAGNTDFFFWSIVLLFVLFFLQPAFAKTNIALYKGMIVSDVKLKFPPDVKTEGMKALIKTKPGKPFNINDADNTIKLIYSTGQCANVELGATAITTGRVSLKYICRPVLTVSKIKFYGVKSVPPEAVKHSVYLEPNAVFYTGLLNIIKDRIIKFYNNNGFMTVHVKVSFTKTSYSTVRLQVAINEGYPAVIKTIDITGNHRISESILLNKLNIKKGEIAVKSKIDRIIGLLNLYYHSLGYWQAYIRKPEIIYSYNFREAIIKININAGPVYVFNFVGNKHISDDELLNIMGIKKSGGFLNFELYKTRIEMELKNRGYYFSKVEYSVVKKKRIHVVYRIHKGRKIYIAGIFFRGNKHIGLSALRAQMLTRPWRIYAYLYNYKYNGILAPSRFNSDIKAIIYLYKRNGFLNIKIKNVKIDFVDPRKEWINLIIFIDEGKQTTIRSISISGVSESMNSEVMNMVGRIKLNGPFNIWKIQAVKRDIEQLYFSRGYINAGVNYNYNLQGEQADILFKIKEGKRIRIGRIIVAGNTKTADWVIKKNLDFKTGMYFIPDNIIRSRINLLKTGYFENVNIKPITNTKYKNTVNVIVIVKERKTRGIAVSAGYGTVDGYRGAIDLYDNNIMGTARSLNFHLGGAVQPIVYTAKSIFNSNNYATNLRNIELGYKDNYLFDGNVTGRINLIDSYVRNLWVGYALKSYSAVAGIDKNIGSALRLSLQYNFEIREPMDVQPDAVLSPADIQQRQLGIISPIIIIDMRNKPFNPTNGYFQILRVDWSKSWFFSQEEYLKIYTAATKYIPLTNGLTYVLSIRGGYAWPLGTTISLPIEKRFYLGGGSTIRGFVQNTVGPMGLNNRPVGGDIMINYQTEVRIKLIDGFDGVVFADGGNVWASAADFELKGMHDIRKTAGVGIRYLTPAGALNLDVGFKLNKRRNERLTAWHFYIGTIL